jgi:ATP-binding cassette subfamily B multidrug efflux pump
MLKLVKYLRPFIWSIVVILLLLFAQAMADLSLPGYMSNIVNIGIQAGGIENAVPQAVRASEFNKLTLFMTENETAQVTGAYILLDKASLSAGDYDGYVKTYPELANAPVYKLNTVVKEEITRLDTIFRKAIIIVSTIERSGLTAFSGNVTQIPAGVDPFTVIAQLPPAQLEAVRTMAAGQLESIPETMLKQYATVYISAEYKALGMNVSH